MDNLVSTAWLAERLGEPNLVVIDASAHLPDAGRNQADAPVYPTHFTRYLAQDG